MTAPPTPYSKQATYATRWRIPVRKPGFLLISGTTDKILQSNGYKLYYTVK